MKHLYFVRHGLSVMNQQGVWSGTTDTPLTEEGRDQAQKAGQKLSGKSVDCIVASPVARAHETAKIIATELNIDPTNIITNEHFTERDFGPLEGTPFKANLPLDSMEGVEHSDDLIDRVAQGLEQLKSIDAETIVVVSHGAVGRALYTLTHRTLFHHTPKFENAKVVKLL